MIFTIFYNYENCDVILTAKNANYAENSPFFIINTIPYFLVLFFGITINLINQAMIITIPIIINKIILNLFVIKTNERKIIITTGKHQL